MNSRLHPIVLLLAIVSPALAQPVGDGKADDTATVQTAPNASGAFCARDIPRTNIRMISPSNSVGFTRSSASVASLYEHFADDPAIEHASEALVESLVEVSQPVMIETHEVQDRRVKIPDVTWLLDRLEAQFIR